MLKSRLYASARRASTLHLRPHRPTRLRRDLAGAGGLVVESQPNVVVESCGFVHGGAEVVGRVRLVPTFGGENESDVSVTV